MYIRGLDGLRAIAMFLVFLTHKTEWGEKAQLGFAGVWIFFLLSGFLITGQLSAGRKRIDLRRTTLRQEVVAFWIRRAMRIFPAYYVLLLAVVPYYLLTHRDVPGLFYYLTYVSNFFFQTHPSRFLTTFAHLWTLAVEEQFYIFFAPILLLIPLRFSALACGVVIAASLLRRFSLAQSDIAAYVIYIDSLVNFGLLALGGLLYLGRARISRSLHAVGLDQTWAGVIALLFVLVCPPIAERLAGTSLVQLQSIYVLGAIAASLLLMNVCLNQTGGLTNLLECRPVAYFGRISYGLYLYNDYVKVDLPERAVRFVSERMPGVARGPISAGRLFEHSLLGHLLMQALGLIVCLLVMIAIAQLSWTLIEKPALRLRDRLLVGKPKASGATPMKGPVEVAVERERWA